MFGNIAIMPEISFFCFKNIYSIYSFLNVFLKLHDVWIAKGNLVLITKHTFYLRGKLSKINYILIPY